MSDLIKNVVYSVAVQAGGGYIFGKATGQQILGAKIGGISAVAEVALHVVAAVIVKNTSGKTSHMIYLKACNIAVVGVVTVVALASLKAVSTIGLVATCVYYSWRSVSALVDAKNMADIEQEALLEPW